MIPSGVKARVSVEAAIAQGWREIVGDAGEIVSLEHFGASAAGACCWRSSASPPTGSSLRRTPALERVGVITGSTTGT